MSRISAYLTGVRPVHSGYLVTLPLGPQSSLKDIGVLSPVQEIVFELCAESLEACLIAKASGAARIELCSDLNVDGLTPSHALVHQAVQSSGIPVYMLLRPRGGDFVYTDLEFSLMREDLLHGRSLGVSGFALGVLSRDGTVDAERTRELVDLASPLEVTFHRAFDSTPSLPEALEDVIRAGCRRILTSGGASDVYQGADRLAQLVRLAHGRVEIAVGGGLREEGAATLVSTTGARHFHGSVRHQPLASDHHDYPSKVDPRNIQRLIASLHSGSPA